MTQKPTVPRRKSPNSVGAPSTTVFKPSYLISQQLCLQHSCPIQYLCFTCSNTVLCSHCISSAVHLHHDVKNIDRSQQFLNSQLQEWKIRLESKKDLLEVFYNQLRNNPAELFKYAKGYQEKIVNEFEELSRRLTQKLRQIVMQVTQFSDAYKANCHQQQQKIRNRQVQLEQMLQKTQEKLKYGSVQHQAQYYSEKRGYIDCLLDQGELAYYKQQFVEPNWGIDPQFFKTIHNLTDRLTVSFKHQQPINDLKDFKDKVKESLKKSVKKSKKDLKLPSAEKVERHSIKARNSTTHLVSPFSSTFTPKNASLEKKIKSKKSPGETLLKKRKKSSAKIVVSMPASPQKEHYEVSYRPSPKNSPKMLFKKK